MLIYTSGTSGDPKAVICSHGKVAIAGVMMTERFGLGPDDVCYVSMPLFHSNAVLVGLGGVIGVPGLDGVAAQVLCVAVPARRPALRRDVCQLRRQAAVLRARHPGASRRRRQPAAGGLRQRGRARRRRPVRRAGSAPSSSTDSAPPRAEWRSAAHRTPRRARWARCPTGTEIIDVDTGEPCPPGVTGEIVNTAGAGPVRGLLQRPRRRRRADGGRRLPQRRPRLPRRERLRVLRGPARRLDARRRREPRLRADRAGAAASPRRDRGRRVRDTGPRCRATR